MKSAKNNQKNKNIFLWSLYNFANTPIYIAMGGLFLGQWLVINNKVEDIWYGATFTLSTILLLITSPFAGAWSDRVGKRLPFLKWSTYFQVAVGLALGITATSSLAVGPKVIIILILFFFLQYFYQISLVFHNAILSLISNVKTLSRISGISETFDNIGWLIGPALLLPFAMGYVTLFGTPGRAQVFIPAILVFLITGLPMLLWFKESRVKLDRHELNFKDVYRTTIAGLKTLIKKDKNATRFLISFMLVSDAILTANLYFAIFLDQVFKISDFQKYIALGLIQIVAIPSCYILGKIADKVGIKKILVLSVMNLTFAYGIIAIVNSVNIMYVLSAFTGLGFAGFYTASRALLVKIAPSKNLGEYFGFYSTFQKFASIIGPITYGAVTLLLKDYGVLKYRAAILVLSMFMLLGLIILFGVKEEKSKI